MEVSLNRLVRINFREYFTNRYRDELGAATFFPIGWSRDGKFAYYTEPVDEACGCYFAKLIIIDLKTDSVLWSFDFEGDDDEKAKLEKTPRDINSLWKAKRGLFSDKLNEHGIMTQGRFGLLSFPATYKADQLSTVLRIEENTDEESRPYGIVSGATLHLKSKRFGKKTLFEKSYPDAKPLDMKVLAYIKSPYEERIAVILMEVYRGYEGPPHTGHVKITGATLNSGFK
jgi:hypothetical protein